MELIENKYTVLTIEYKLIGFDSKYSMMEYIDEFKTNKIREYCENEGLDYECLTTRKLSSMMNRISDIVNSSRIYRTRSIVAAVKKSELDKAVKDELIEVLLEYNTEFYVDEYEGFYEIINVIDEMEI